MGALDGKRMSASRGHAILSKDLLNEFGPVTTRLIILLSGGNLSKAYNYDRALPETAKKMVDQFSSYLLWLATIQAHGHQTSLRDAVATIETDFDMIEEYLQTGYFRQAVIELMVHIPKKYPYPDKETTKKLLEKINVFAEIFLPGLYENCVI
jgi:leucyl-tRNA synthetase